MRCVSPSSPTSSQVTCGLLKSFIFIIILGLASSCEAQGPQDVDGKEPRAGPCNPPPVRPRAGPEPGVKSLTLCSDRRCNARRWLFLSRKYPLGDPDRLKDGAPARAGEK